MTKQLKLIVDTDYETRDGRKAFVSAVEGSVYLGVLTGSAFICHWAENGYSEIEKHEIIGLWADKGNK